SLTTSVPRIFIERGRGFAELGIFTAIAYLMNPGTIVITAIGLSATPRLARLFADGDRSEFIVLFAKMTLLALAFGVAGVIVAILIGEPLLRLLFHPDFADHVDLLVWLMIVAGLGYVGSIAGYAMRAARIDRGQVPLFLIVCGVTALGCW